VGVEEEFMLVDAQTMVLAPAVEAVVAAAADVEHVKPEIRQCMIEIASRPFPSSVELGADLEHLRAVAGRAAAAAGCRIAGRGTHPFSHAEDQPTTNTQRYLRMMDEGGFPSERALVFGTHVHVALASADKAIQVTEALLPDLPVLVALAASSPFWDGRDTGMASNRLGVWSGVPRTGLPPWFASFEDYQTSLEILHRSGAVPDASHVWWDVRSQDRLGTLEFRAMDGQPSVQDTAALAGLLQALVHFHGRRWDGGERVVANRFVVGENRWLAIRHGLDATFAAADGRGVPARAAIQELLDRLAEDAQSVGAEWALDHVARLADAGGPVTRARETFAATGDLGELVRSLATLTDARFVPPGVVPLPRDVSRRWAEV
jgi:carboxylate-amine ligase